MPPPIILASASVTRHALLQNAGLTFEVAAARIDEAQIRESMLFEGAPPHDMADALAEMKARKVSDRFPDALVIGCDQLIDFAGRIIGKAENRDALRDTLRQMRGKQHDLLSAVVVYQAGSPLWRHIGKVRMTMHAVSDSYLEEYLDRNWHKVRDAAGGYLLEGEGVRLMSNVNGDYFTVLGLPLVDLLTFLGHRGAITR